MNDCGKLEQGEKADILFLVEKQAIDSRTINGLEYPVTKRWEAILDKLKTLFASV